MNTGQKLNPPKRPIDAGISAKSKYRMMLNILIPIVILGAAVFFFKHQMDTRPKARRTPPPKQAKLVEVIPLRRTNETAEIPLMGKVVPSREITLSPEVTGMINIIDSVVIPGGIIQKGQTLFKIDSRDYETIVKERQSDVAQATLNLKLESGSQTIAQQEYKMLGEVIEEQDKELLLRKPHLEQTQIKLDAAKAMLEQAELNVRRCTIEAPFNSIIKKIYIDIGARVSPSSPLVNITGIDEYWIEVPIPENQLQWIEVPRDENQTGSPVKIYNASWKAGQFRKGNVIRLLGQLEEQARRAQLLVSVKDPLCLKGNFSLPKLLIGSYVHVYIEGIQLPGVFRIKREYLRDGNSVWIMNSENKLEVRSVEVIFRNDDAIYVKNRLEEGEQLIITDLSAPVEGMDLRLEKMKADTAAGENNG